jgi:hypothetical protein
MIRPELMAPLRRWSEVLTGLGIAIFGLWAMQSRDQFFQLLAGLVVLAGLALAFAGWRRLRFQKDGQAPGIVQVLEAQISYFGPETGGFIGAGELVELHLLSDGPAWRLIGQDGTRLDVPVAAEGAQALYDIFAALPGIEMGRVLAALDAPVGQAQALWLHPSRRGQWRALR